MQIDCDTAPWVRDKVPVFCEKRTEVVDNTCVTTRGCSVDYRWEDVRGYQDIRGGQVPCTRRKGKETCWVGGEAQGQIGDCAGVHPVLQH